jgi:hypothetical protein
MLVQISRPDLVYYDWEITQDRLHQMRTLGTHLSMAKHWPEPSLASPTRAWLTKLEPLLGNSITEVTLRAPNELKLLRKSHLGLTGFELVCLTRWLESPGFPLRDEPPPQIRPVIAPGTATNRPPRSGGPILAIPQGPLPGVRTNKPAPRPR